jgi:hypothetical protein
MIRISKSDPVTQLSHIGEGVVFLGVFGFCGGIDKNPSLQKCIKTHLCDFLCDFYNRSFLN